MAAVFKQLVLRSSKRSREINLKEGAILLVKSKSGSIFAAAKQGSKSLKTGR
jgi:hypothetical protein